MELEKNNPVRWNYKDIILVLLVLELLAFAYSRWGILLIEKIWADFTTQPINSIFTSVIGAFLQSGLIVLMVFLLVRCVYHESLDRLGLSSGGSSVTSILGNGIVGGVLLLLIVTITSLIIYFLFRNVLPLKQQHIVIEIANASTWQELSLLTLVVSVLAPFSEELLFRGMLYGWLRQRLGVTAGIWLSGLIFAVFHFDLLRLFPLVLGGAGLAYLYQRTGSLYTSIVAHAVWNSVMTLIVRWLGVSI